MQDMTPNQPYLLKAFYDWIVDNGMTPYLVVDAHYPNVQVPTQFVNEGQIVLNVSPNACVNFSMDVDNVQFQARFGGQPMLVSFPCLAVGAIYSKENGAGTSFAIEHPADDEVEEVTPSPEKPKSTLSSVASTGSDKNNSGKPKGKSKASLKVIK